MKSIFTLMLLFFWLHTFAQTDSSIINKIDKTVKRINDHIGSYTTKTLDEEEFTEIVTDGGGQVTGYFKNRQLVKMEEFIGLSICINLTTYYLKDNKLIFTYMQGKMFDLLNDDNPPTVTMECSFYFDNDKMIKSILKGETGCGGQPQDSWAKDDLECTAKYINLFKKKK